MVSKFFKFDNSEKMITEEKLFLGPGREKRRGGVSETWSGVALSGGGIRSATIALGVLQALSRHDLLKKFDYISTVSGGGYIGASLQWWWSNIRKEREVTERRQTAREFGLGPTDFPFGTTNAGAVLDGPKDSKLQLDNANFLRNHGNYLSPGSGITAWSLVAVVMRTVFLSLWVWFPLASLVLAVVYGIDYHFKLRFPTNPWQTFFGGFLPSLPECYSATQHIWREVATAFIPPMLYGFPFVLLALLILLFVSGTILFGLLSRSSAYTPAHGKLMARVMMILGSAASFLILYWLIRRMAWTPQDIVIVSVLATVAITLALRVILDIFRNYGLRRGLEWLSGYCLPRALFLLLIVLVPLLSFLLAKYLYEVAIAPEPAGVAHKTIAAAAFGIVSGIGGVLSALYGYYSALQKSQPGLAGKIFAPIGAALFLFAFFMVAYCVAVAPSVLGGTTSLLSLMKNNVQYLQEITLVSFIGAAAFAMLVALFANVNNVGLHRFYRDRLMEAYLPGQEAVDAGRASPSAIADRLLLSDLVSSFTTARSVPAPFPIMNAIAILTKDDDHVIETRGGDNFALTPLFVGCNATGWESLESHNSRHDPFTLATAMAASGAAVNSNAGYIGTGETRNPLVSKVMTLLNMRLGIWIGTPNENETTRRVPNFLRPMLWPALIGRGQKRSQKFLELADGGNFENLGLYELVRRKLGLILVVDGEADETIALPALVSAIHRIYEDFGATVSFAPNFSPDRIVPSSKIEGYPGGAQFAAAPFLVGEIAYSDGTSGVLIYIKSVLFKDVSFTTAGYRARFADFPHQSTLNQFFDPNQFEAYRDLGYCSSAFTITSLRLIDYIDTPKKILELGRRSIPGG